MLKPHLTRDSAEQYILGALSPEASAALEAHTLECEPCARLLQEEAVLSEQLHEVALPVVERQCVADKSLTLGDREYGGRVESPGQQHDRTGRRANDHAHRPREPCATGPGA